MGLGRSGGSRPPEAGGEARGPALQRGTVWIQDGAFVRPIRLRVGLSDGTVTEVVTDKLTESNEVVIASARIERAGGGGAGGAPVGVESPFAPKLPFRPK